MISLLQEQYLEECLARGRHSTNIGPTEWLTHPLLIIPTGTLKSNCTSMYFPNRLELSFRRVLAFPKAWG